MLFFFISILVPVITYLVLPHAFKVKAEMRQKYTPLLLLACMLFFISWYLPSPLIDGRDTAFMTHLIGGGVFSGCIWLYVIKVKQWHLTYMSLEALSLYAVVSTLGVFNELAELLFVKVGWARLVLTDTSWDLFANTLGALMFYITYKLIDNIVRRK